LRISVVFTTPLQHRRVIYVLHARHVFFHSLSYFFVHTQIHLNKTTLVTSISIYIYIYTKITVLLSICPLRVPNTLQPFSVQFGIKDFLGTTRVLRYLFCSVFTARVLCNRKCRRKRVVIVANIRLVFAKMLLYSDKPTF